MRSLRIALVLFACLGAAEQALAQSTCVTPSYVRLQIGRSTERPLTFRWLLPAASIEGAVLADGAGIIQRFGPLPAGPVTQTVVLDEAAVQRAIQSGSRRITIVRAYADPMALAGDPRLCAAIVEFGSGLGGPLDVNRIQLRFDEGSPLRIVPKFDEITAYADLVYTGDGELVARWEVAGPESTAGTPVFRVLSRVRRYITGGGRVSIESPRLPTEVTGLHLLRLVIETPALAFVEPTLRYYVTESDVGRAAPAVIGVRAPPHASRLGKETRFTWAPLEGASAYRLELYEHDRPDGPHLRFDREHPAFADLGTPSQDRAAFERFGPGAAPEALETPTGEPVAGVLVDGETHEAVLSAWARGKLRPGHAYVFVVRGLAEEGIPIGMSAPRVVYVPAEGF